MASIWKGSLTFGLVHVPVELKTAVRSDHVSFRMLHADDLSPIKYERVCAADGEPGPVVEEPTAAAKTVVWSVPRSASCARGGSPGAAAAAC